MNTPNDKELYETWLSGYIAEGGEVTNWYDYPFERSGITHWQGQSLEPKYGANSDSIVFLNDQNFPKDTGHNEYFVMDGFKQVGLRVPCYSDMKQWDEAAYRRTEELTEQFLNNS